LEFKLLVKFAADPRAEQEGYGGSDTGDGFPWGRRRRSDSLSA
jgi:hypothetical protein